MLSDAVAHATQHFDDCDLVVDMATLTGAQLISTGKTHAGILANTEELEQIAVKAGLASGDLCYPLLYAPELLKKEFNRRQWHKIATWHYGSPPYPRTSGSLRISSHPVSR